MIDITNRQINFRGYPLVGITDGANLRLIRMDSRAPFETRIEAVLKHMEDTAGPGEPSGWLFEAVLPASGKVWLERCGGVLDEGGHHGGHWVMLLPHER